MIPILDALRQLLKQHPTATSKELSAACRESNRTISEWASKGYIPAPARLAPRTFRYDVAGIIRALEARASEEAACA